MSSHRFDLSGKVIVVTGGNGLLGSAYCQALAEHGAQVVLADLPQAGPRRAAEELAARTGVATLGVECNVASEAEVVALFGQALERFGRVDGVMNNAAATGEHLMRQGAVFSPFEDYPLAVWEEVLRVNLTGVFLVAREGGKALLASGGGSMINVSSTYGVVGPDHRIYEGMKFASFPGTRPPRLGYTG